MKKVFIIAAIIVLILLCLLVTIIIYITYQSTKYQITKGGGFLEDKLGLAETIYNLCNSKEVIGTVLENCKGAERSSYDRIFETKLNCDLQDELTCMYTKTFYVVY